MIEVLVTIVIIAFGLLGVAGLQVRLQSSEVESYQRTQALLLLDDISERMKTNRLEVTKYAEIATLADPAGVDMVCNTAPVTRAETDVSEWCQALRGAAESASGGAQVGAMIGGRGCVQDITDATGPLYRVSVAWQGLAPLSIPADACGKDLYNGPAGTPCQDDRCRRVVTTVIRLGKLN
jgi:type IV pilus assembly protein PilV